MKTMKRAQRQRIDRLYNLIERVPFPASGTKTTAIAGLSGYAEDMRQFIPAIREVLFAMMAIDCGNPELIEDEDYKNPDEMLAAIEAWVALRASQQWAGQPREIKQFYKHAQGESPTDLR
jgi:hypothetical protein